MPRRSNPPPSQPPPPENIRAALNTLTITERKFVLAVLAGASYENAALAARRNGRFAVLDLLGRVQVARALQLLVPLLPDQERARALLAPFALRAQTTILLSERAGEGTRASAAREILAPTASLRPAAVDARRKGAGAMPSSLAAAGGTGESPWERAKRESADRRKRARDPFAGTGTDGVAPGPADLDDADGVTALPRDEAAPGVGLPDEPRGNGACRDTEPETEMGEDAPQDGDG